MKTKTAAKLARLTSQLRNALLDSFKETAVVTDGQISLLAALGSFRESLPSAPKECLDLPNKAGVTLSKAAKNAIRAGAFIDAIKEIRACSGLGLKESKDVAEEYMVLPNGSERRVYDPNYRM